MSEYIDGLIEGSHRKTDKEHFAFHECSRKRLKLGELAVTKRKAAAKDKKSFTFKPFLQGL